VTRGSIYWVSLEDCTPPEFGKTRLALVLSNTDANLTLGTVVAVPISTRAGVIWPLRLAIPLIRGMKPGFLVLAGIRQISKKRLHDEVVMVPDSFLTEVETALEAYLGE